MKVKARNLACFLILACFLCLQNSFAEEVGFVKKTWRKAINIFRKSEPKKEPAPKITGESTVKEVPQAAPQVEAEIDVELAKPYLDNLTETELLEEIKYELDNFPEIIDRIPELKVTTTEDHVITKVEFEINGVLKDIQDLSKEELVDIFRRVSNEGARVQVERIQEQLEAVRAAQQSIQSIPKTPHQHLPPQVPQAPETYAPPQLPPSPPKLPEPPPQPPPQPPRR